MLIYLCASTFPDAKSVGITTRYGNIARTPMLLGLNVLISLKQKKREYFIVFLLFVFACYQDVAALVFWNVFK